MNSLLPPMGTRQLLNELSHYVPDDFINELLPPHRGQGRRAQFSAAQLWRVHLLSVLTPVHGFNLLVAMLPGATGLAYIGHSVWVFEGHPSALAPGCREAELLIVDEKMIPFLNSDWLLIASAVMRRPQIFAHERATLSLRRLYPNATSPR